MKELIIAFTMLMSSLNLYGQGLSFDKTKINFGDTLSLLIPDKSKSITIDLNQFKNLSIATDTNAVDTIADILLIPNNFIKQEGSLLKISNTDKVQFVMLSSGKFELPVEGQNLIVEVVPPNVKGMAEIKPIEQVEGTDFVEILKYILPLFILAALAYFLYKKWKNRPKEKPVIQQTIKELSPYEKAIRALNEMRDKRLYESLELKEFQTQLGNILRIYLNDEYKISAMKSTTSELIEKCKANDFKYEATEILSNVLSLSDLVKFAKAKPGSEVCREAIEESIKFINLSRR